MTPVFLLLVGCSGQTGPTELTAGSPLDSGWIATIADQPELFAQLMDGTSRPGWVAFHKADYREAAQRFDASPGPRARAWLELAAFEDDLARLAHHAWPATFSAWEARSGLPGGSAIPMVAALATADAGDVVATREWLAKGGAYADADVAALANRMAASNSLAAPDGPELPGACVAAHLAARAAADDAPLTACGPGPLVVEAGDAHMRELYDPLTYNTLAIVYRARAAAAQAAVDGPPSDLGAMLFSSTWAAADLAAERDRDPTMATAGAAGPTLAALGLDAAQPLGDDPQWARDRVRELDSKLDSWFAKRLDSAPEQGKALLVDLDIVPLYRSRVLLAWARRSLVDGKPEQARAFAQLGIDVEHGTEVGPTNPPGLFAVLAESNLLCGRTREALDALQALEPAFPEVAGLDETIGDLAILQGLDRQGDSKEN